MNDLDKLRTLSTINRQRYITMILNKQKAETSKDSHSAQLIGYDTTTGRYICQTQDGRKFLSQSITNGGVPLGGKISLQTSLGIPSADQMPR